MTARISFRNDLQGLRAIAVIAVMVFHLNPAWLPGGFVGVDIFLVISGYLIASILLLARVTADRSLKATLQNFYLGRIKRIAPAYYVMVILISVISAVLFIENDFEFYVKSLKSALVFNSNNYFSDFGDYFAPGIIEQPLLHTWSLAIEMQFYLLFPFLILLLPLSLLKKILPLLMVILILVAEYMLRVKGEEQSTYYSFSARVPEFVAGGLVALYSTGSNFTPRRANYIWSLGLLLIICSLVLIQGSSKYPGLLSLIPTSGAVLLIVADNASLKRFLSWPILVWVGALSYSLYLWHWPILAIIRYYTGSEALSMFETLSFVFLTLLLSMASFYWVESRFYRNRQAQNAINKSNLPTIIFSVALTLLTVGSITITSHLNSALSPPQLPIEQRRYADQDFICHGKIVGDCIKGDLDSQNELLVLGDSHGAMLNYFFDYLGKEQNFKARIITASSCVTIPRFDYQRLEEWAQKPCISQIGEAEKYLKSTDVIIIAGMWSYQLPNKNFIIAIEDFFRNTVISQNKVFVMEQIPMLSINPARYIRIHNLGLPIILSYDQEYFQANQKLKEIISRYPTVNYVEQSEMDFFLNVPFFEKDLIYLDHHHLNEFGAKRYAREITNECEFQKFSDEFRDAFLNYGCGNK